MKSENPTNKEHNSKHLRRLENMKKRFANGSRHHKKFSRKQKRYTPKHFAVR